MKERMKRLFYITDEEGKQALSILRAAIGILATIVLGATVTWFTWVTTQAYDVAINKELIIKTGQDLEKSAVKNEYSINELKDSVKEQFERNNSILHGRISNLDSKYDNKISELQKMLIQTNTLIVELLIQKNKEVDLQKENVQIQQKLLNNGHSK